MIDVHDQDRLIEQIVGDLLHESHPTSCNLVVPPGFAKRRLAGLIADCLEAKRQDRGTVVAFIEPDNLKDPYEYVAELHRQWSSQCSLPDLDAIPRNHTALNTLVGMLPSGCHAIQLISRFHTIIECLGLDMLGKIRSLEQEGRVRTLAVTPLPYYALKQKLEEHTGRILTVSNYGNNPVHACHVVQAPTQDAVLAYCSSLGIPRGVSEFFLGLTGGYPEILEALLGGWIRSGRPGLRPETRRRLTTSVIQSLRRFIEWMDYDGTRTYCELAATLYQGLDTAEVVWQLRHHAWRDVILLSDELRSEALGMGCQDVLLDDAISEGKVKGNARALFEQARSNYQSRRFENSLKLIESVPRESWTNQANITYVHANIMTHLYETDGESRGADSNWPAVASGTEEAIRIMERYPNLIADSPLLLQRYSLLSDIAKIISAVGEKKSPTIRLVDTLAGLFGPEFADPRAAALVLVVQTEAVRSASGHTTACLLALPLPEQIFRVWAFWALNLNFYSAPSIAEDVHVRASAAWPKRGKGELKRPEAQKQFPSFPCFAYYCLAIIESWADKKVDPVLEPDFISLDRALAGFELRHDTAHAVTLTRRSARNQFLALVERWLKCLVAHCPVRSTYSELRSLVEPLPLVDDNWNLLWI
jgi:hypothetical protein